MKSIRLQDILGGMAIKNLNSIEVIDGYMNSSVFASKAHLS